MRGDLQLFLFAMWPGVSVLPSIDPALDSVKYKTCGCVLSACIPELPKPKPKLTMLTVGSICVIFCCVVRESLQSHN